MTVYSKTNPVGLDKAILRVQNRLSKLSWSNIDIYGRLYINDRDNLKVAEAYSTNGEYKEVFVNDKKTAVFGFVVTGTRQKFSVVSATVKLICSVNIKTVYGSTERKDEEALLEVLKHLTGIINFNNQARIQTRLQDVFSDFSPERFKYRNMQPWFNFSLEFDVNYKNDIC
jgi:hypothetical protein